MHGQEPRRIIFLRGGAIGDCVASLPTLRLVRERFPRSEISVLGNPYNRPVLQTSSDYDHLFTPDADGNRFAYIRDLLALRRNQFDLLLGCNSNHQSRFQTRIIGARRRIGFTYRQRWAVGLYTDIIPYDRSLHITRRLANLLSPYGTETNEPYLKPCINLSSQVRQEAQSLLNDRGVRGPFALLQATTSRRREHRLWPEERFAAVAEHLRSLGLSVVVATSNKFELVDRVARLAACPIHIFKRATSTQALACLADWAHLYVGYNTGTLHLASAFDTPIVGLFDIPADATEWYPATDAPWRIVQAKTVPEPPGWRMDTIQVPEVLEAINQVWEETQLLAVAKRQHPLRTQ